MNTVTDVTVEDLEADPYPLYARLRRTAPVVFIPSLDVWMVTRWDDVVEACLSPERFPAHVERSTTDRALGGISMMTTDGEPAKQRRRPFDSALRPRAVEASMPDVFRRLCQEQLDIIEGLGTADLVKDYFEPISLRSLGHALGIDEVVDVSTLRTWFEGLAAGVSNYEDDPLKADFCDSVSEEIDDVLRPRFAEVLETPDGRLLSNLIHAVPGTLEQRLDWAMPSLKLVLLGGLQEPAHGGATVAFCLLNDADQSALVHDDPRLVEAAVEEGLRWTAPIGNLLRGVGPNTTMGGVELPMNARVILVVASANHDEEVWGPTAGVFDIRRPKRNHLSFAIGPHYCIGHHFARMQLRMGITMLFERYPDMRLDPDHETVFRGHEYRSPQEVKVSIG